MSKLESLVIKDWGTFKMLEGFGPHKVKSKNAKFQIFNMGVHFVNFSLVLIKF